MKRFLGCLQGRFKIRSQETHEWSDTVANLIGESFFILHILILRMSLDGELEKTAVTDFYEECNGNNA